MKDKRPITCFQCDKVGVRHTHKGDGYEIRHQEDGLDEVIAKGCTFHLERMTDSYFWMGIDLPDGTHLRLGIAKRSDRGFIDAYVEVEKNGARPQPGAWIVETYEPADDASGAWIFAGLFHSKVAAKKAIEKHICATWITGWDGDPPKGFEISREFVKKELQDWRVRAVKHGEIERED